MVPSSLLWPEPGWQWRETGCKWPSVLLFEFSVLIRVPSSYEPMSLYPLLNVQSSLRVVPTLIISIELSTLIIYNFTVIIHACQEHEGLEIFPWFLNVWIASSPIF
jgi:hypothetical protein